MNTRRTASGQLWRTFAAPLVIALASAIGLVAALVGDGFADLLSWIGLGVPVLAVVWAMLRRRR